MEQNDFDGFVIDNDSKAEWALKKIKEASDEHDRLIELVKAEMQSLEEKKNAIDRRYTDDTAFLKYQLSNYMESVNCKSTKTQKTYQLLTGKLVHKYGGIDYIKDEEALTRWAVENRPSLVETTTKVKWGELKKELISDDDGTVCTQDGEIIDFIKAERKPDTFDIKF